MSLARRLAKSDHPRASSLHDLATPRPPQAGYSASNSSSSRKRPRESNINNKEEDPSGLKIRKQNDLTIYPVPPAAKPKVTEMDQIHPLLPKPPFAIALVAPKGSGKSTIIYNMVSRPDFYYKRFDQVWMLSPTFYLDDTYAKIRLDPQKVVTDIHKFTDVMTKIIKSVEDNIEFIRRRVQITAQAHGWDKDRINEEIDRQKHESLDRILIIIDDAVGIKALERGSLITNSFTRHRHLYISFLYAIQLYKAMPTAVRVNLSAIVIFNIPNRGELKKIVEEQAAGVDDKTWLALYNHATDDKYSFLYINYKHETYRYFKCFNTPLVVNTAAVKKPVDITDL